jgi:predicted phosphoribosyltransferase
VFNEQVVRDAGLGDAALAAVRAEELGRARELERTWRGLRPRREVAGREVVVCDDGLATGATMRAALLALLGSDHPPRSVLVGLPVAPRAGVEVLRSALRQGADEVVAVRTPLLFRAVSWAYEDFRAPGDDELRALLAAAAPGPIA